MVRESSPLWVWFTVGLLVLGSTTYIALAFFMEHMMAAFQ